MRKTFCFQSLCCHDIGQQSYSTNLGYGVGILCSDLGCRFWLWDLVIEILQSHWDLSITAELLTKLLLKSYNKQCCCFHVGKTTLRVLSYLQHLTVV